MHPIETDHKLELFPPAHAPHDMWWDLPLMSGETARRCR